MSHSRILRLVLILGAIALAQSSTPAQQDPPFELGLKPFGSYHGGDIDTINVMNGQLGLDIPLISYPQRGGRLQLDYHLRYLNVGASTTVVCFQVPYGQQCLEPASVPAAWCGGTGQGYNQAPLCHGFEVVDDGAFGWVDTVDSVGPNGTSVFSKSVITPDGGQHTLAPLSTGTTEGNMSWGATDNTGVHLTPSGNLINRAGITQYSGNGTFQEDSNGNSVSASSGGLTDTMGRVIPSVPTATSTVTGCPVPPAVPYTPALASAWSPPSVNGGTYPILFCYVQLTETNPLGGGCGNGVCKPYTYTGTELQSVVLPNGTTWTFEYTTDGLADLTEVIFPTGGSLSYTSWQSFNPLGSGTILPRSVGTRTLNPNDGITPSSSWTYAYSNSYTNPPTSATIVSAPPSSGSTSDDTVHSFTFFGGCPTLCDGFETTTQYYQGSHSSGTILKTLNTTYTYQYVLGISSYVGPTSFSPQQVTATWANGEENKTTYTYDTGFDIYSPVFAATSPYENSGSGIWASYGDLLTKQEYDYGSGAPGSLLRTTTRTYVALSNSNYLAANLLDLPSSVQVTGSGPGSLTDDNYDENNGSPQGALGNLTSTHRWLNTTGGYLVSSNIYNSNGLVISSLDPKTNPTGYGYSSNSCPSGTGYAGSGPTSVTNALGQTTYYCYDLTTGLLTSLKDANSQTTGYVYDDMLRTTQISYPDTSQATFSYPTPNEVETAEKITGSTTRISYLLVDGVGREIRHAVTNGESLPYNEADSCYDGNGRVKFKSYPFQDSGPFATPRSCASPEAGDASAYDALGRKTSVTHSDTSSILTSYTGRATSVQDEGNGTQRVQTVSQVDGLGRLASVCEVSGNLTVGISGSQSAAACGQDIAATGFLSSYVYDAIDDLTSVIQSPLNARTFVYDSLSRLTSSTNPEAGTTTFTYDADNNVLTRKDARSITTTYTYDALNRVTSKTYSDGTPTVSLYYDLSTEWGVNLGSSIGRLAANNVWNGSAWVSGEIFAYDPMGRVINNTQCNSSQTCSNGPLSYISYTYDLLGDVTSSTDGEGVTLTNTYNAGARLTSVTSSMSDSNHPPTLFGYQNLAHYNAAGSLTSVTLGNNISETRTYDGRLRLCAIQDGSNGSIYSLAIPSTPTPCATGSSGYAPDNDVVAANDSVNGSWTYGYDAFNRLVSSSQNSGTTTYSYADDRFGNRWNQIVTHGSGTPSSLGFDANNHITASFGVTYDAAGDTTYDGTTTYTYDAEHRVITASNGISGSSSYAYDADGRRVQKTTSAGGTVNFLYDLAGHEIAQTSGGSWQRGEIYAGDRHVATYYGGTTYFIHPDWLGTERARSNVSGALCESIISLPYGDAMTTSGSCGDPSPMHFTGKERDSESGLDNFGARYDASSMGRFMSPDWSSSPEPVPYATRDDPQSLNLYTYARNNPVTLTDPDGHCWGWIQWLCDTGQRFYYAFTDFGFVTHAQVDAIKRQYLIDQRAEINGEQRDYTKATDKQVEEDYDKVMDAIHNHTANQFPLTPGEGGTSPNQMQQQVSRGQAPDSVDRVDSPRFPNEKPHIEFKDGNALNKDGTWKHGGRDLTNAEKEWITDNGWSLPKQ